MEAASDQSALLIDTNSNWDTSTIQDIQFQICQRHQEEAKAFCTICNSLLCVFCMINEEPEEGEPVVLDHAHKAVNAKTYCAQSKRKWKDLQARATKLDSDYDRKIEELGSICSTMFKQLKGAGVEELEQQMGENKQKVDLLKRFVKEVNGYLEKVSALEQENRADLMVMFNQKLNEYNKRAEQLDRVLSEMTIRRVIEDSFSGDKDHRAVEQTILSGEENQKSVNGYLIQKIHTLEDRVNAKFDSEQADLGAIRQA